MEGDISTDTLFELAIGEIDFEYGDLELMYPVKPIYPIEPDPIIDEAPVYELPVEEKMIYPIESLPTDTYPDDKDLYIDKLEQARLAELERQRLAELAEQERLAELERQRLADLAEQERLAELERERLADLAEQERLAELELQRLAELEEIERLARIAAELRKRQLEEEELERQRLVELEEQQRLAELELQRLAELEEIERLARIADEERRLKLEEEQRLAELEHQQLTELDEKESNVVSDCLERFNLTIDPRTITYFVAPDAGEQKMINDFNNCVEGKTIEPEPIYVEPEPIYLDPEIEIISETEPDEQGLIEITFKGDAGEIETVVVNEDGEIIVTEQDFGFGGGGGFVPDDGLLVSEEDGGYIQKIKGIPITGYIYPYEFLAITAGVGALGFGVARYFKQSLLGYLTMVAAGLMAGSAIAMKIKPPIKIPK